MTKPISVTLAQLVEMLPAGLGTKGAEQVKRAYEYAKTVHGGRRRKSHELYIDHDLAVAHIVAGLRMDLASITASLLHDVLLPHTSQAGEDVQRQFGQEVGSLVTGLDKLSPYTDKHSQSRDDRALEAIRRAILTIIEGDARVILIHLADRLQDLRKASDLSPEDRTRIAVEARDIHAPLANRLGVWQIKWELEDLAFRYLDPEQYRFIAAQLAERRAERNRRISEAVEKLSERISQAGIQAEVTGRPKHIYSIYRKMQAKGLSIDRIYDIRALRVIVTADAPSLCYQVLGIVHNLWQPIPHEFDDYIARAKSNGYQSLHTAVIDETGQTLEVQIRTQAMHDEAERGIASHWAYKEGGRPSSSMNQHVVWLRQLLNGFRDSDDTEADDDAIKAEILGERIYVFTPRGDVIDLPVGATPIDFAYAIHTEVGHRCRGARVNGKMVGLDYRLSSGEQIEIITASKGGPSRDWMNENLGYTASSRTRSKIRGWFRQQERAQNISQGREVVLRELKRLGVHEVYTVEDIASGLKYEDVDRFLAKVGFGDIQSAKIGGAIASLQQKLRPDDELRPLLARQPKPKKLTVRGIGGLHTNIAGCCNPIPPEPIMGYITRGRGVTIHRKNCGQLLATREPERWIDVEWGLEEETYPIPIVIKAFRRPSLMDDIANILKGQNVDLSRTKTTTANSMMTIYMVAEVTSLDQLNWILRKFEKLNNVIEARRQRWSE